MPLLPPLFALGKNKKACQEMAGQKVCNNKTSFSLPARSLPAAALAKKKIDRSYNFSFRRFSGEKKELTHFTKAFLTPSASGQ